VLHTGDEPPRKARRSQLRRELLLFTACTTTSSPVPHGEPAGRPVASRSAPTLIGRKRQARAARLDGFGIGRPVARATSSHAAMACLRFVGQPRARAWSPATATASTSSASARKWVPDWVICAASASARSWLPARAIAWTSVFSRSGRCRRTTRALVELVDHVRCQGIQRVVLESTSDYWSPFCYLLEAAGLVVWLVNAAQTKNVLGHPRRTRSARCG
jgi:hypothetical protein